MSTLATPQPTALLPLPSPADVYRISVDLYERMIDSGSIGEDEPIELLNGVLVRKSATILWCAFVPAESPIQSH